MTINDLLAALCEELAGEGVPDVLHQPVTLAALWADLARLAGEPLPRWVAAAVAEAAREPVALTATGRAAAWVLIDAGAPARGGAEMVQGFIAATAPAPHLTRAGRSTGGSPCATAWRWACRPARSSMRRGATATPAACGSAPRSARSSPTARAIST